MICKPIRYKMTFIVLPHAILHYLGHFEKEFIGRWRKVKEK
jgi:hypothetical protein